MFAKTYRCYRRSTSRYRNFDQQSEVVLQPGSKTSETTNRKSTATRNDLESEKLLLLASKAFMNMKHTLLPQV